MSSSRAKMSRAANHKAIVANVGLVSKDYAYYNPKTIGLDFDGFKGALREAAKGSVFLLHACAHNPTGVDPTRDQWTELAKIFKERGHYAFFDCAYQGFAVRCSVASFGLYSDGPGAQSGSLDNDAWAVRHFVEQDIPLLVCQSYAKNAGLCAPRHHCHDIDLMRRQVRRAHRLPQHRWQDPGRGGPHHEPAPHPATKRNLQSANIRRSPGAPPRHLLLCYLTICPQVSLILNDESYFKQWNEDIETMAHRIARYRLSLRRQWLSVCID
jgi:aspartate aminotransferase